MEPETNWLPSLIVLVSALGVGVWLALRTRFTTATNTASGSSGDNDLDARIDQLVTQLRELEDHRDRYGDTYEAEKSRLEVRASELLRQRGDGTPYKAKDAGVSPAPKAGAKPAPGKSTRTQISGFLWGVGTMAVLGGLYISLENKAQPDPQQPTMGTPPEASDERRNWQQAVDTLRGLLAGNPKDLTLLNRLGHLLLDGADSAEGRRVVEQALALSPGDPEANIHLAGIEMRSGNLTGAVTRLEPILAKHTDIAEGWLFLGMSSMRLGNMEAGTEALRKYVEISPPNPTVDHIRQILDGKPPMGSPAGGVSPAPAPATSDIKSLNAQAHALLKGMRMGEAQSLIEKSLQLAPKDPEARVHGAILAHSQGQTQQAIATLNVVLEEHPTLAEGWFFRGMMGMQSGDPEMAQASWRKFVEVSPDGPQKDRIKGFLDGEGLQMPE